METLYKVAHPEDHAFAEYYQPSISQEPIDGKWKWIVVETHAWYDDSGKRVANHTYTLRPDGSIEGFDTRAGAVKRYAQQIAQRAKDGFVHGFTFDPFKGPMYRQIDPNEPMNMDALKPVSARV